MASALHELIGAHGQLDTEPDGHSEWQHHYNLALQILHNLKHQHRWTDLKLHEESPLAPYDMLARPMLSGLPPRRLYVHPDEQIEHLKLLAEGKRRRKEASSNDSNLPTPDGSNELLPVREWVLPTHIREKWSLKKMGGAFDSISNVPPEPIAGDEDLVANGLHDDGSTPVDKWRQTKRLLLATLDDDSTVVYYIVHDGIVKPRQN